MRSAARVPVAGQFQGIHHLAADSDGNLYVAESAPGSRVQKFVLRGMERL